jgi:3-(methylthio)propionyl---CoA ligase
MYGHMMQQPLLISSLLTHAERHHGEREIVSRRIEGGIHRTNYRELAARARRVARALARLGVKIGERVATLACNGHRHLELYYAVSGSGAVLHTLNPRLHPEQLAYIAAHAEDAVLCFDTPLAPLITSLVPRLPTVRHFIVMTDRAHLPAAAAEIPHLLVYEDLVAAESDAFDWPLLEENSASSLCYTSGTTGHPKGVLYSHRSTVLHTYASALPDVLNCSANDTVLPIVPMFHANAWGLPYVCCMVGAKLVLPGPRLEGESLYELIESEGVTFAAGVPTVWQGTLACLEARGLTFSTLKRILVGGSACPPALLRLLSERYGIQPLHAWGMTETSPLGTVCTCKAQHAALSDEERYALMATQGRAVFGVDFKVVDAQGSEIAWGCGMSGDLLARGPWVAAAYFKNEGGSPLHDGWFFTGDRARIDGDGYLSITDRSKDVIKSGGEWIGSIELENIAMAHPAVAMAACIAAAHPRWAERPLLIVVRKPGAKVTREELLAFYDGRIARWWTPDDVVFVDAIPLGATGKMQKHKLREQFRDHKLPSA